MHQVTHMFCLHNNLLPKAFQSYCSRPSHMQGTRFSKNNYVFPKCLTRLQEKSIKTIGPRVWAEVPQEAKILPYKKTFAKHMKTLYIKSLPSKQSSGNHITITNNLSNSLQQIFLNESTNSDFLGFDLELDVIFSTDDSDYDFYGFDLELATIFNAEDDIEDFHGFN